MVKHLKYILLLVLISSFSAWASPLSDARDAGLVIEVSDGYVRAQNNSSPRIQQLVVEINEKRRIAYSQIAARNGITVEQVGVESYRQRQAENPH